MGAYRFPELAPGPLRDLKLELHELHAFAAAPSLREMAEAVECSHDKIHKLFTSAALPADGDLLFRLAGWLALRGTRPRFVDDDGENAFYEQLEDKWRAAQRYASLPPMPASPAASVPRGRQRRSRPRTVTSQGASDQPDSAQAPRKGVDLSDLDLLPDPQRSKAVIIGSGTFDDPHLPDLASAVTDAHRMTQALTDSNAGAFLPERTETLIDPSDPGQILNSVERACQTEDTVLLYFVGHGLVTPRGELTLPTRASTPDLQSSSLRWDHVRSLFAESPALRSIVIIDSCYSGTAMQMKGTVDGTFRFDAAESRSLTAMLTSTSSYGVSFENHEGSVFTNALLGLLTQGDPKLGKYLTVEEIHRGLLNWARREGMPLPQRYQQGHGALALARNPAHEPLDDTLDNREQTPLDRFA